MYTRSIPIIKSHHVRIIVRQPHYDVTLHAHRAIFRRDNFVARDRECASANVPSFVLPLSVFPFSFFSFPDDNGARFLPSIVREVLQHN